MANIHISLVGGQAYPVYLGIMDQKPDKVILVCSPQSKEIGERVAACIPQDVEYLELDPVKLQDIYDGVHTLADHLSPDDTCTINISGGTKLWSIVFYDCFRDKANAGFMYVDQNCYIYNLNTRECRFSEVSLDTDTLLKLNGSDVKSYIPFEDYTDEDIEVLQKIKKLFKSNYRSYSALSVVQNGNILNQPKGELEINGNSVSWDKPKGTVTLSVYGRKWKTDTELVSPHAFHLFFNTGWFEYDMARRLAQWKHSLEVRTNVVFAYKERAPKNEIDIIVNTGYRLLFVECKTQIYNITDIDKFRSAVKNYGGMASKALFVVNGPLKDTVKEKCKDNGVLCFSLEDMKRNDNQPIEKTLFALLDDELYQINKG